MMTCNSKSPYQHDGEVTTCSCGAYVCWACVVIDYEDCLCPKCGRYIVLNEELEEEDTD